MNFSEREKEIGQSEVRAARLHRLCSGHLHPAQADPRLVKTDGEHSHEDPKEEHTVPGHGQDLLPSGLGVDVRAVKIVCDETAHGDKLGGPSRSHGPAWKRKRFRCFTVLGSFRGLLEREGEESVFAFFWLGPHTAGKAGFV